MKIAIDLDDVLCDLRPSLINWYNERMNTRWSYDDFTQFNMSAVFGITPEQEFQSLLDFHTEFDHNQLPVMSGAREAVDRLSKDHELLVLTSRPIEWREITISWVEANFPSKFKEVSFANPYAFGGRKNVTKGEVCKELGCVVLIDDDARHWEALSQNGIDMVLMNKPWNIYLQLPPTVMRVDNWSEVESVIADLSKA